MNIYQILLQLYKDYSSLLSTIEEVIDMADLHRL